MTGSSPHALTIMDIPKSIIISTLTDDMFLHNLKSIAISGQYAYTISPTLHLFIIIDILDPVNPVVVGTLSDFRLAEADGVWVNDEYAYVSNSKTNSVITILIENQYIPILKGILDEPKKEVILFTKPSSNFAIHGKYAYGVGLSYEEMMDKISKKEKN